MHATANHAALLEAGRNHIVRAAGDAGVGYCILPSKSKASVLALANSRLAEDFVSIAPLILRVFHRVSAGWPVRANTQLALCQRFQCE